MIDLPLLTDPDDVLAQPTRARLFTLLAELRRPVGTGELAERIGLHPNGVRVHLGLMEDAGLITRRHVPQLRGRPRDGWTISSEARPGGERPSAYVDLGRWLARAMPTHGGGLPEVEATGRQIGRELVPEPSQSGASAGIEMTLATLGFAPHEVDGRGGAVTFCLGNCPFRDAARENQELICTLHRGMTRGLLDILSPDLELSGFEPGDPESAGCLIELAAARES